MYFEFVIVPNRGLWNTVCCYNYLRASEWWLTPDSHYIKPDDPYFYCCVWLSYRQTTQIQQISLSWWKQAHVPLLLQNCLCEAVQETWSLPATSRPPLHLHGRLWSSLSHRVVNTALQCRFPDTQTSLVLISPLCSEELYYAIQEPRNANVKSRASSINRYSTFRYCYQLAYWH
jgi:hypothetical protein